MTDTVDAKKLQATVAKDLEKVEKLREQLEEQEQAIYDQLKERLQSCQVEGSEEDKLKLRETVSELDNLMDTRLFSEINDGRDKLAPLRETAQAMAAIENGGDVYGDDYEEMAEMCGLELSDHQGCWTYQEGECMNAGQEILRALEEYEKTGKPGGGTSGDLLDQLAWSLKIDLD